MILREQDGKKFQISGGTEGVLFAQDSTVDQTMALVQMDGCYPEKGFSKNDFCTETLFVIEGEMTVLIDNETFFLKKHNAIAITPGKKYRISGKVKVIDFITPKWDSSQNHIIEN